MEMAATRPIFHQQNRNDKYPLISCQLSEIYNSLKNPKTFARYCIQCLNFASFFKVLFPQENKRFMLMICLQEEYLVSSYGILTILRYLMRNLLYTCVICKYVLLITFVNNLSSILMHSYIVPSIAMYHKPFI